MNGSVHKACFSKLKKAATYLATAENITNELQEKFALPPVQFVKLEIMHGQRQILYTVTYLTGAWARDRQHQSRTTWRKQRLLFLPLSSAAPAMPTICGFRFDGWLQEAACGTDRSVGICPFSSFHSNFQSKLLTLFRDSLSRVLFFFELICFHSLVIFLLIRCSLRCRAGVRRTVRAIYGLFLYRVDWKTFLNLLRTWNRSGLFTPFLETETYTKTM